MKYITVILTLLAFTVRQRFASHGRHRMCVVAPVADPYLVRRVDGATSHRRRQGGLIMPTWGERMAA